MKILSLITDQFMCFRYRQSYFWRTVRYFYSIRRAISQTENYPDLENNSDLFSLPEWTKLISATLFCKKNWVISKIGLFSVKKDSKLNMSRLKKTIAQKFCTLLELNIRM